MGTAATFAILKNCSLEDVDTRYIREFQQQLLKDDCYIPGFKNEDAGDLARLANVSASSEMPGCPAALVTNGVARSVDKANVIHDEKHPVVESSNMWVSASLSEGPQSLYLTLKERTNVRRVQITFDSNLSRSMKITMSSKRKAQQVLGAPPELVKDYDIILFDGEKEVLRKSVRDNYQRLNRIDFEETLCDKVQIRIISTNGVSQARVFEVRIY